jgi:hypothetical protein
MADYLTTDTELASVASAIRSKGGTSSLLVYPTGFVNAINAIPTGGGVTTEPLSVTVNGTYTAPSGKAYSPVTVNVEAPEPTLEPLTVTENGNYTPGAGVDGFSSVRVNVSGGSGGIKYAKYYTNDGETFEFDEGDDLSVVELQYNCVFSGFCIDPNSNEVISIAGSQVDFPDTLIFSNINLQDSTPITISSYGDGEITVDHYDSASALQGYLYAFLVG